MPTPEHMDARARVTLELAGVGIRTLARELAGEGASANEVEQWRRTLYRVREGKALDRADRRAQLAARFNVDPAVFAAPPAPPALTIRDVDARLERIEVLLGELATARDEDGLTVREQLGKQDAMLERMVEAMAQLGESMDRLGAMVSRLEDALGRQAGQRPA